MMIQDRLVEIRTKRGRTQQDVADFLNVKRQTYGAYERGASLPDAETLRVLADYYHVTADYLLGREEKEKPAARDELLSDPQNREFLQLYSLLTPEERQFVLAAIKGFLSNR